jgi:hypothetical protein
VATNAIYVRPADDDDVAAILRVLQDGFQRWPRAELSLAPLEHLRWKMRLDESPERLGRVAIVDDELAGVMLTRSVLTKIRNRTTYSLVASDAAVLREYRERGVMRELRRSRETKNARGYALSFSGQTEHPAMIKTRAVNPDARALMGNELVLYECELGADVSAPTGGPWTISEQPGLDERTNGLCEAASEPFEFLVNRNFEYLNWRFNDSRSGKFTFYVAEQEALLCGYLVLAADHERQVAYIADLLTLPGSGAIARSLVGAALASLHPRGLERARCWLPRRHPYAAALLGSGFRPRELPWKLGYRVINAPEAALAFLREPDAAIHFMLSDTDMV